MTGISIFSIPKPFHGHVATIQDNAIRSWKRIPGAQVMLLGDDAGVTHAANGHGVLHIPTVKKNEFGTPLLDHAFALAAEHAEGRFLCTSTPTSS